MPAPHPKRHPPRHAVLVTSGGLNSTVLAHWLAACHSRVTMLSFDYGRPQRVELHHAAEIAELLAVEHHVVDLTSLATVLRGSASAGDAITVPDGHNTVMPNRTPIMLDIAIGLAVVKQADAVAYGAHSVSPTVSPDCRQVFVDFTDVARRNNKGFLADDFAVLAPFLHQSKVDIVRLGLSLGVPFDKTWSCHREGTVHCGTCATCVERVEAFVAADVADPTRYAVRQ
ncbi:putative PP-loop superfamily ATPase [Actinoalloteichus fjordicus]|uniref:7-cyano-7-deazaguanine synthase n=1 Tax=Actinoalloteichus fjordicus TaxID=1612552 RepID=A0AAC9LCU2_9PSEU|nr:7-cyano-7-deazaguanine synthase [Actinoalloteichus fjordicus]APU15252.1 putative PP-loop superfamily ATPase [Actinoalloteichus fjordicus]